MYSIVSYDMKLCVRCRRGEALSAGWSEAAAMHATAVGRLRRCKGSSLTDLSKSRSADCITGSGGLEYCKRL